MRPGSRSVWPARAAQPLICVDFLSQSPPPVLGSLGVFCPGPIAHQPSYRLVGDPNSLASIHYPPFRHAMQERKPIQYLPSPTSRDTGCGFDHGQPPAIDDGQDRVWRSMDREQTPSRQAGTTPIRSRLYPSFNSMSTCRPHRWTAQRTGCPIRRSLGYRSHPGPGWPGPRSLTRQAPRCRAGSGSSPCVVASSGPSVCPFCCWPFAPGRQGSQRR